MQDFSLLVCSVPAEVAICQRVTPTGDFVSATVCVTVKVTLCRGLAACCVLVLFFFLSALILFAEQLPKIYIY